MQESVKVMRVAAYCRVSTDHQDQANSLKSQQNYFHEYISKNPLWTLAEVYVDEGITGTSTKKRADFNRMITDAGKHQFDLIITKEISRFARNTLDSIFYTRKLKDLGIGVIFMNDNINTLDPDAELRLTIMSSIAQEESRKTSDRVKWGQKRRMEQGVVFGRSMLGYDVKDGHMSINEDGAKIVRLIFHKFVNEKKGTHVIARELMEEGFKSFNGMREWSNTVILRLLRNEKYVGDLKQKKTYTPCYLNHDKKYNNGEEEFVVIHDHHEPIISHELFNKAEQELSRRRPSKEQQTRHSNRYCFSGKIKCGFCGRTFVSRTKKRRDGSIYQSWRCYESASHGKCHLDPQGNTVGCDGRQLGNQNLLFVMSQVTQILPIDKESITTHLTNIVKTVMQMEHADANITKLQSHIDKTIDKKHRLIDLYLSHEISEPDFKMIHTKYENEIGMLEQKQGYINVAEENSEEAFTAISDFIHGVANGEIWDETFYRNILGKMVVFEKDRLDVYLNHVPDKLSYRIVDTPR